MFWKERNKVDQREQFIYRYQRGESMTDLCREYEISRKTGYKFVRRFKAYGKPGLEDLSRRPHHPANKTDEFREQLIIDLKMDHPPWGTKKLKRVLERQHPQLSFPAVSTMGMILERNGLRQKRPRRIRRSYAPQELTEGQFPNQVWCIDFKGQFKTRDQRWCYPLTISDHKTRYLIACEGLEHPETDRTYRLLDRCFREYGLPQIIRSDNGAPFASLRTLYGLTRLSVWLLQLGIQLERIEPGHPEQNGRHERMHRTLKLEALRTVAANLLQQQERLDTFRQCYNRQRPHEALAMQTPEEVYTKSPRTYQGPIAPWTYPPRWEVKKVDSSGCIILPSFRRIWISKVFQGQTLGLYEREHDWWIRFQKYDMGILHKKSYKFESIEVLDD